MAWIDDRLSEQFYRWELRTRGWQVAEHPVRIEPPFRPFTGHFLPPQPNGDDGRRHTFMSGLLDRMGKALNEPEPQFPVGDEEAEPALGSWERESCVELQLTLPRERKFAGEVFESLLLSLASAMEPVAFEIMGSSQETVVQWVCHPADESLIRRQVASRVPCVVIGRSEKVLAGAWSEGAPSFAVAEFGLAHEFVLPLNTKADWQSALFAGLSELGADELGLCQIIFEPVRHAWAESGMIAVSDGAGGPFFVNQPELLEGAKDKFACPLFAVVLRFAASAADSDRAWRIMAEMASGLATLSLEGGNGLVPLANDEYPSREHEEDLLRRQSRRTGMLLNLEELAVLVRFPDSKVHTPKLRQDTGRTKAAPDTVSAGSIVLGENVHAGVSRQVSLTVEQRVRHMHVLGASGTGKSNFLFNLIRKDIERGEGVGLLDPHGDLVDRVMGIIPEHRLNDVVLIDPADEAYSVGFNILSAHSDFEKTLLASDLVSVFQRLSTSWGDQMASVLNNAILAFLESSEGGTLADLRKFLLDAGFRREFLKTVQDADIAYYWEKGFPQLGGNRSIGPVLTRLESFLAPKPIRYMVSQRENRIDFADITDSGKIFLARLSQGQMGRENAWLLGSLIVSKFQHTAMARQRVEAERRRPFWLYIDEFQNFMTPSMAEILGGARKYRLGLVLAHQELGQLRRDSDVANAVMSNACTRVVFRVSDSDAKALEPGFAHFTARELQNLGVGEAICRVERSDADFNLATRLFSDDAESTPYASREAVIEASRAAYGTPVAELAERVARPVALKPVEAVEETKASTPEERPVPETSLPSVSAPVVESGVEPAHTPPSKAVPPVPAELGRGGEVHRSMQRELKAVAESLGFRATIEKQLPGTLECTDLLLERDGLTVAVELTITNTLDYELRNIAKCLRAGVSHVAVIGIDATKLRKIEAAAGQSFGDQHGARVKFFIQDEFIRFLQEWVLTPPIQERQPQPATMLKGWKVKTTTVNLSPQEAKEREAAMARTLADAIRRMRSPAQE